MDKLAQDARKAKEAGMSCGKWKAMQPSEPYKKPLPDYRLEEQKCLFCGVAFVFNDNRKRKFCGDACRNAYHERKRVEMARKMWEEQNAVSEL